MYGEVTTTSVVPPVVATGTAVVLPATGADTLTSLAATLAAGLAAWGIVYLYVAKFKAE